VGIKKIVLNITIPDVIHSSVRIDPSILQ